MDIATLCLVLLSLLVNISVFSWQANLISTMKTKLEVLEKFQNIFDLDRVEQYVKLVEKDAQLQLEAIIEPAKMKTLQDLSEELKNRRVEVMLKHKELMVFTKGWLKDMNESDREYHLSKMGSNETRMRTLLEDDKRNS